MTIIHDVLTGIDAVAQLASDERINTDPKAVQMLNVGIASIMAVVLVYFPAELDRYCQQGDRIGSQGA